MLRWFILLFLFTTAATFAQIPSVPGAPSPPPPPSAKRVEVDKTHQMLRAYEGGHVVLETRISTGKWDKSTPNGQFQAGPKERMHYSRLFHNAPMPYAVQVHDDVFIHGFTSVPHHPASHGCIRLPLDGDNAARRFFEWIEPGTPIEISGQWQGD
jgi:lipoprotein-anchoring transpeptidase ErfK/SrfK